VAVATWQDLAKQICAAQGSGYDEASNACGEQRTSPTPLEVTLTSTIELEGGQLPTIFGKLRIQGACGGVGQRCAIHAVSQACSSCPSVWDIPPETVPQFEYCNLCHTAPNSLTRLDNTPFRVSTSSQLWLEDLELMGAQSPTSGGLITMDRGSDAIWTDPSLASEMAYVKATNVLFRKGFSEQQGGALYVEQGCLVELHRCEFQKNYAAMFQLEVESNSAHDILVANAGRLLVRAPTPAQPKIKLALEADSGRLLGRCFLLQEAEGEDGAPFLPSPPPLGATGQPTAPSPPGQSGQDVDPEDNDPDAPSGPTLKLSTTTITIIACSLAGGVVLCSLMCVLCCVVTMNGEEKSLPAKQRVTRRLSRAVSTTVTGLKTMRSIRPNYVQQSDYIVTLWDDKQRAEKAAASANKRARAAEQTLKNNGLTPQGWRGFASGVSSVGDSLFRSLSRALSIGTRKSSVDRALSVEAPGSIPEAPHRGPSYAQGSGGRAPVGEMTLPGGAT